MARLVLFLPALRGGGAERVMIDLAGGFVERGHAVTLVVNRRMGELADAVPRGVRVVELHARSASGAVLPLARWLRVERPDVLLSAMTHANLAAVAAVRLARTGTRVVVSEHNAISARLGAGRAVRQRLHFLLARRAYARADGVVAVSRGVAEEVVSRLHVDPARVAVIYNPVVSARTAGVSTADHPWLAEGQPPVLLGAGRLTRQKGFDLLLEAFALLRTEREARLVVLGQGEERDALLARARQLGVQDDVALPGFVADPHAWMRRAGAFVLSSRWEGFGVVLVEALAAGCPVASFDCPHGPAEVLAGGIGELAPAGDVRGLAEAAGRALDAGRSPEQVAARERRAAEFARDTAVDRWLAVLLGPADRA